jgi:hypothetical protein
MKQKVYLVFLTLVLFLTLVACQPEARPQKASLTISLESATAKTIMPKQNLLSVTRYSVEGIGPNGASFSPVYSEGSEVSVSELTPGQWTITARSYNAEGVQLAMGTITCTLSRGGNSVTVVLDTIPGTGTAQIAFTWDQTLSSCSEIKITAMFETDSGVQAEKEIKANTANKKATLTQELPAGSYVVRVQVTDSSGNVGIGAAEALRIVDNTQSIGVIPLASVGSGLNVAIENKVAIPMQIYIDYTPKVPIVGESLTLTVKWDSLPDFVSASDLKFQWYRDGVLMKVGSASYSLKAEQGIHRYDAVVTNARKGSTSSATVTFSL